MASAAARAIASTKPPAMEKIVDFAPEHIKAPFVLRCAALSIDYILLLILPVGWLVASKVMSETPGDVTIGTAGWVLGFVLFIGDFLLYPLLRGQTLGKMVVGLTILKLDGTDIDIGVLMRRNLVGYLATMLTLGIGFLIAAVNTSGRSLHDFIGGTVVIRGRKMPK